MTNMVSSAKSLQAKFAAIMSMFSMLVEQTDMNLKAAEEYVQSWDIFRDFDTSTMRGTIAAQTSTVIQAVVVVVVASVGVVIVDNIDSALGAPANTGLSSSQEGLLEGFGSMIDLIEPLLIVLIAVVLIAVVQRIRQ